MSLLKRLASAWKNEPRAEITSSRSPATWFLDALYGRSESSSGVVISDATALSLSAYYCGINMIAGTVGSLPLNVMKHTGRNRDVWPTHPAHYLLHTEPNPEMTAMSFRQTMVFHAIHRGNAYAEIVWDARGNASQLWIIPPHLCTPRRDDNGKLWYEVRPWDKEVRYLPAEDVLHVPGLGYDGVMGYGLMQLAGESIGLNSAQDQYAAKFFRNGGNISGAIETDKPPMNDNSFKRLRSEIATKMSGLNNAHRIAILENGMKFKPMNPTHADAQLVEARRFTVEEWARWLNIPPHKLREMTHATFSNIEHQNIEWVVDTIRPWLVRFEQEFNRKLFFKQSIFYTKHSVEGLLRGDQAARYAAYAIGRNWGWLSANDVRELEDMNPLPGEQGDIYLVPLNMVPADQVEDLNDPVEPPEPDDPTEPMPVSIRNMARATAERIVRFETNAKGRDVAEKVTAWAGLSADQASRYCATSVQLALLAADMSISQEELNTRRVELLGRMILGEEQSVFTAGDVENALAAMRADLKVLTDRQPSFSVNVEPARQGDVHVDARTTVEPVRQGDIHVAPAAVTVDARTTVEPSRQGDITVDARTTVEPTRQGDVHVAPAAVTVDARTTVEPSRQGDVHVDARTTVEPAAVSVDARTTVEPAAVSVDARTTVEPAAVTVNTPDQHVTVNTPETHVQVDAPAVNVTTPEQSITVNTPEQAAPVVNVTVEPPQNTVMVPEQAAPVVNVAAADVNVTVQPSAISEVKITSMPTRETTSYVDRDGDGNIVKTKQIETDA